MAATGPDVWLLQLIPAIVPILLVGMACVLGMKGRDFAQISAFLGAAIIFGLIGNTGLQSWVFKGWGLDVETRRATERENDAAENIAPMRSDIQKLKDEIGQQKKINEALAESVNKLAARSDPKADAKISTEAVQSLGPSADFEKNNKYTVLVFYRDTRFEDSQKVTSALVRAGFKASAINSELAELKLAPQPEGSSYVSPTERGAPAAKVVAADLKDQLPEGRKAAVTVGPPVTLRRGDLQVYLF